MNGANPSGVKKIFQNAFDFLLFTSLYIAICAVGMVYQTSLLFHLELSVSFYGFVFFGTLCSYNFHWLFTPKDLPADASLKSIWHHQHRKLHWVLSIVSLIASALFTLMIWDYWEWLLASALFTFLYSAPKIPFPPFTQLRKIAYGKTVFLALAWMHITTQLPLLVQGINWQMPHYLFVLNRFFLIYAICILFDARDRQKDRLEGIKSMITQMNAKQVAIIYFGILLCLFVSCFWLGIYFPIGITLSLTIPGLLLLFLYQWLVRQTSDYVFYFGLDGLMVFSLLLMLLFPF